MTREERLALDSAVAKLRRAESVLLKLSKRYGDAASRIEALGQLDPDSSEALSEAVKLLGEP